MITTSAVIRAEIRSAVRVSILQCEAERLELIAWEAGLAGFADDYEAIAREELAAAPHDTQEWWGMPCNRNGLPN